MRRARSICRPILPAVLAILCLVPASRAMAGGPAVVTDVRVGENLGGTRFVLDLTRGVDFSVFTLADPYRVVIDMTEVGWQLPARALPRHTGLLERLRYGLFREGTSRVVLDINRPAAIARAFMLEPAGAYQYRLVVDLTATTRARFLDGIGDTKALKVAATAATDGANGTVPLATAAGPAAPGALPMPQRKPQRGPRKRVIVIDPGHGGIDPGTVGIGGVYEKHITLSVARAIKRQLDRTGRYNAVLTRNRDIFIRLRDRVAFAREHGADLFISVHADAIANHRVRGLSVYTLSEKASDAEAEALADKENKADLIAGVDLSHETPEVTNILIDLAQRESMNQSSHFAAQLVRELARETRILPNSHRFAGFVVLKAPDVPSVLVELGFLSNRQDERALRRKAYRAELAAAMGRAIDTYFTGVEEARRR